jgi:hypothetical protein
MFSTPKWFPARSDGKVFLIAAVQQVQSGSGATCPPAPFRIASFDVTAFVSGSNAASGSNRTK